MAVIQVPARRGENETGLITKWHKKTGDWVAEGDELFTFDTVDGTFTVKSQKAGRLVAVFVPEGEIVQCPADVGMLTTPSPDSVLKLGRQQFLDESKPLEASEPAPQEEAILPEETLEEEEPAVEESDEYETEAEEETEALSEEELLTEEEEAEDLSEAMEAETDAPVSEEELLQYLEEDTEDLEALEPDTQVESEPDEEEDEEEPECEEEAAEQECCEQENCEKAAEPAEEVVSAKPASVTAQADMTLCMDIAARTGVSLGAMVCFAAMHTDLAEYMQAVEANGLRALEALEQLPNVRDLSKTGITTIHACCAEGAELLVPAPHDAWRVSNDALEVYPCLNLTLAFDENVLSLEKAAALLKETCDKLENLIDLLI